MSDSYTKGKLIARFLLYAFLVLLALMLFNSYRIIRNERVCTRFSMLLTEGQHELVASLPSGFFLIQFTTKPNVSPSMVSPPGPVLPANISTTILRQDGSAVVGPTQKEYVTFTVSGGDAFRPLRLSVRVTKTNECTIYMNMASGF